MTLSEACGLVLSLTRELSAARRERDGFRLVAHAAVNYAHDLHVELERTRDRYHQILDDRRQVRRNAA